MGAVNLPFNPQPGNKADVYQLDANFQALAATINGQLEAGVNVVTGAPLPQSDSVGGPSEGTSNALARADHKHTIQGLEQQPADPTSGNFVGRAYFDSTNLRTRLCIAVNSDGTGAWVTSGNLDETDLPNHADRHASGGADALPALSIDQTMRAQQPVAKKTLASANSPLAVTPANTWVDVVTNVSVTTDPNGQLCLVLWKVIFNAATSGHAPKFQFQVIDDQGRQVCYWGGSNLSPIQQDSRTLVELAVLAGPRTLKAQCQVDDSAGANILSGVTGPNAQDTTLLKVVIF